MMNGLSEQEVKEIKQIIKECDELFEIERKENLESLLQIEKMFKNKEKSAKFIIQTGLKEAIEEVVFEHKFPDKLLAVWDDIERNLKK